MNRTAYLLADLGFGDAGKGSCTDFLVRRTQAHTVIRYNGGAQAGHNVVTADGRHHTFAQFGSGTFVPGVRTHLSRFMLLSPTSMLQEEAHLAALGVSDAFERTTIDRRALVITPFQQAANRLKEIARDRGRHGSCGMGIGETMSDYLAYGDDVLFAGDLDDERVVRSKLGFLRAMKRRQLADILPQLPHTEAARRERVAFTDDGVIDYTIRLYRRFRERAQLVDAAYLGALLSRSGSVVFEGAQGVLLDEWHGFHPYTTWSTTTFENALTLLDECGYKGTALRLGLTRAYATRHGPGPFVTEDPALTRALQDPHNTMNLWQRAFRVGSLDLPMLRYAHDVVGRLDGLVVTCLDRLAGRRPIRYADRYRPCHRQTLLDRHFHLDAAGTIIRPRMRSRDRNGQGDLVYQEALGRMLQSCKPVYERLASAEDVPALLEASLGVPLAMLSHGPTARDKTLCGSLVPAPPRPVTCAA